MSRVRYALALSASALLTSCSGEGTAPLQCEVNAQLLPGEALFVDPTSNDAGCGILLPSGAAGARYRVALFRPDSAAAEATASVTLDVEGVGVTGSVAAGTDLAAAPQSALLQESEGHATADFHAALRRSEGALVEARGTAGLLPSRSTPSLLTAPAAPAPPRISFDPQTSCSAPRVQRAALLRTENDVMAIYQDSVEIAVNPVRSDHMQRMLSFFASYGKETVESYFGRLPDVDGNGRVNVVLTSHPFPDDNIVAFVWAGNFYARSSCPASDEMEVIFVNPARVRSMERGEFVALGVLSHESEHLVSLFHRLARTRRRSSSTFLSHPTWMEEGRAELADEVTSRRAWSLMPGGPSRTARVGGAQLDQGLRSFRAESYGVALEALRTMWYLSGQPNGLSVVPQGAIAEADIRNGGWHFHRWLGDAHGSAASSPGADAALFRSLTDSLTASGAEGLADVVRESYDGLVEEFIAAIMLHGASSAASVGQFSSYDFPSLIPVVASSPPPGRYPWPVTTSGSGTGASISRSFQTARYTGPVGPTGVRIHELTSNGTGVGARLKVETTVRVRLVIVRLQ